MKIVEGKLEGRMRKYSNIFIRFWLFNDVTQAMDNVFRDFSPLQLQINSILKINYVYHH